MLRAGPFSDERVVRLANRRFVPFCFDLSDQGAAGDPVARAFVVPVRPELGAGMVRTPPVLFMDGEGKVLGEVSNYADADTMLAGMLGVLREHPEYNAETEQEKGAAPAERAEIRIDLQDCEGAGAILMKEEGSRAHYLLGRLARFKGDWTEMEARFKRCGRHGS